MNISFKDQVYMLIRQIPAGKVATYGQVAELVGAKGAARAVGMCMKSNPDAPRTPCHRIVGSDGRLTGYSAGEGVITKKAMLLTEGVFFKGDRVDLERSLWDPTAKS